MSMAYPMFILIDCILFFAFVLFTLVLWILMLIDCFKRKDLDQNEKIKWLIILFLATGFGAIIYWIMVKKKKGKSAREEMPKQIENVNEEIITPVVDVSNTSSSVEETVIETNKEVYEEMDNSVVAEKSEQKEIPQQVESINEEIITPVSELSTSPTSVEETIAKTEQPVQKETPVDTSQPMLQNTPIEMATGTDQDYLRPVSEVEAGNSDIPTV